MGRLRVAQVMTERHIENKSLKRRRRSAKRRDKRHCGELLLSHPGAGYVYEAVSHVVRPLSGESGHQGDEKIIAPSVRPSRDRGLMDTTGN